MERPHEPDAEEAFDEAEVAELCGESVRETVP